MKQLLKGTLQTFSTKLLTFVLNLIATAIYTRVLGPSQKGIFSFLLALSYLVVYTTFPPLDMANAYLSGTDSKPATIGKIASYSLLSLVVYTIGLSCLVMVLLTSSSIGIASWLTSKGITTSQIWLTQAVVPTILLFRMFTRILQGLGQLGLYNFLILLRWVFYPVAVLITWNWGKITIESMLIIQVLNLLLPGLIGILLVHRMVPIWSWRFEYSFFKDALNYASKAYIWNAAFFMDRRFDIFLAGFLVSPAALGYYSAGVELLEKFWALPEAASTALLPQVARLQHRDAGELTAFLVRQVMVILLISSVLLALFATPVVQLFFGDAFLPTVPLLRFLLPGVVAMGIARLITMHFAGQGMPEMGGYSSLVSILLTGALGILLARSMGAPGIAIGSTLGYVGGTILLLVLFVRRYQIKPRNLLWLTSADLKQYVKFVNRRLGL